MARKRRNFNAPFKAKVALEAIKGHRTINEIAAKHKLHATQINLWKKQLLDGAELNPVHKFGCVLPRQPGGSYRPPE